MRRLQIQIAQFENEVAKEESERRKREQAAAAVPPVLSRLLAASMQTPVAAGVKNVLAIGSRMLGIFWGMFAHTVFNILSFLGLNDRLRSLANSITAPSTVEHAEKQ